MTAPEARRQRVKVLPQRQLFAIIVPYWQPKGTALEPARIQAGAPPWESGGVPGLLNRRASARPADSRPIGTMEDAK